jgi:hypothetical protein
MGQEMSFNTFLDSAIQALTPLDGPSLAFPDVGDVHFTTLTTTNLALLRKAHASGYPGLIVSCPDFEREAIATAFLAALLHLEFDEGKHGLHEAEAGEKAAVGSCVVKITEVNDDEVMYSSFDQVEGIDKSYRAFPLVHRASPDADLSRTKNTKKRKHPSLVKEASRYENLPAPLRHILDCCGKPVPSVGYVTSPSQYANEAPTRLLSGRILFDGVSYNLSEVLPITYLSPKGDRRNGFSWPFDCPPSILVGPRVNGVGSASEIADLADDGLPVDFVACNISSPDLMDTELLSDILDLKDRGIAVIAFCDRWTLARLQPLKNNGFLPFDWDDCRFLDNKQGLHLSSIQNRMLTRQHEKVLPVSDEDSGLARAKQILYDDLRISDIDDDDVLAAIQDLFGVLGSAIRMTEAPDEAYSNRQRELIDDSLDTIRSSMILSSQEFGEITVVCDILSKFFEPGRLAPKEQRIYDLITHFLKNKSPVVLVVDRNRTEAAYKYWCGELSYNGYDTGLFTVVTTRDFLGSNSLVGDENVIFSGWYDKGTMDRCLHSGIATNMIFVLYGHDGGDLELEWWLNANEQWHRESDKCALATDKALAKLGIEPLKRSKKAGSIATRRRDNASEGTEDKSPASVVTTIERRRIQSELAREGEKSVPAVPVMFHDGTHVWLKADPNQARSSHLLVITDCLTGQDDEPDQKSASALLPGDVVLRTHSDKSFIRRTSESTTEGYDDVMALAQRWREPILRARRHGYSDAEIINKIYSRVAKTRTKDGVRGWVKGNPIAPQTKADIQAVYSSLGYPLADGELDQIAGAVRKIRNKHRAVGRMAKKSMVADFLKDVERYGLDDAVEGFDERHEAGDIELLRVAAVGERKNVAVDRVDVL